MSNAPLVSVIMSVFNEDEGFLKKAIVSILEQSYSNLEFIILDDGSTQEDVWLTLTYYRKLDRRIRIVRQDNCGLTKTLNKAIKMARGDIIARQDADDWSHPSRIEKQVQFLLNNPETVLVGTTYHICNKDGNVLYTTKLPSEYEAIISRIPQSNPFCHGSVCFKKNIIIKKVGYYREELRFAQDYDYFLRISEMLPVSNLLEPLYYYRRTQTSVSVHRGEERYKTKKIIQKLAMMRKEKGEDDFNMAKKEIDKNIDKNDILLYSSIYEAENIMLLGYHVQAILAYSKIIIQRPNHYKVWFYPLRAIIYAFIPFVRTFLFRK
ncbi:MAG: glycosyltransferase [Pseudomonadota bacterium]